MEQMLEAAFISPALTQFLRNETAVELKFTSRLARKNEFLIKLIL